MSDNFKKEDLRIKKTYRALINALHLILSHQNFNQITVNDLCEEALVSRATFYVHFNDKYDLLKYWLLDIKKDIIRDIEEYEKIETTVNQFIHKNQKIITNVLKDANNETLELVQDFLSSIIKNSIQINNKDVTNTNHIILLNFCTGGLANLLSLHVKNNFPSDLNFINSYLYEMIKHIIKWDDSGEKDKN